MPHKADFHTVLSIADWVELDGGDPVPMHLDPLQVDDPQHTHGDSFYFVLGGQLECQAHYMEGTREFQARSGNFCDAFSLLAMLGQPTAGLAMQVLYGKS